MLDKSGLFGTTLTIGPRLGELLKTGLAHQLLWEENYPDQEKPTSDGRGEFQRTREWIETASLEEVFDLWCRGQNLPGFAESILDAVDEFKKVFKSAQ